MASLQEQVNTAMAGISTTIHLIPGWDNYFDDFHAGIPLLRSSKAGIDLEPAMAMIALLLEKLASCPLPGRLREESPIGRQGPWPPGGSCHVVAVARAGATCEPDFRFGKIRTIISSRFWQSKEDRAFALITVNLAAAT